jgi:hypothetical protein
MDARHGFTSAASRLDPIRPLVKQYDRLVRPGMRAPDDGVRVIRQSTSVRVISAASIVFVAALVLGGAVGSGKWAILLASVPLVVLFSWMPYRLFRMSVEMHPGRLVVRNRIRTWTISRSDVEGFAGGPYEFGINVLIRGQQPLQLGVTARPTFLRRARDRRELQLAELNDWWELTQPARGGEFRQSD